jgi:hypothetical protein
MQKLPCCQLRIRNLGHVSYSRPWSLKVRTCKLNNTHSLWISKTNKYCYPLLEPLPLYLTKVTEPLSRTCDTTGLWQHPKLQWEPQPIARASVMTSESGTPYLSWNDTICCYNAWSWMKGKLPLNVFVLASVSMTDSLHWSLQNPLPLQLSLPPLQVRMLSNCPRMLCTIGLNKNLYREITRMSNPL